MSVAVGIRKSLTNRNLSRLQIASTDYMESVARKIQSEAMQGDDKFTFTEALGIVMIRAGEKLGADCALGVSASLPTILNS